MPTSSIVKLCSSVGSLPVLAIMSKDLIPDDTTTAEVAFGNICVFLHKETV